MGLVKTNCTYQCNSCGIVVSGTVYPSADPVLLNWHLGVLSAYCTSCTKTAEVQTAIYTERQMNDTIGYGIRKYGSRAMSGSRREGTDYVN